MLDTWFGSRRWSLPKQYAPLRNGRSSARLPEEMGEKVSIVIRIRLASSPLHTGRVARSALRYSATLIPSSGRFPALIIWRWSALGQPSCRNTPLEEEPLGGSSGPDFAVWTTGSRSARAAGMLELRLRHSGCYDAELHATLRLLIVRVCRSLRNLCLRRRIKIPAESVSLLVVVPCTVIHTAF
ncbi:hypothetical protein OH76DRAFT_797963 [Lentinus brumalis]|uniref:Uncharacterized protein n=1 Tax=Lentinus brumalis TaxID=2498619 RepID=A0A371D3P5_9APHY|nr:hypothetical protein OH76DRAFT_797963 [Polyporus brumalis]